MYLEITLKNWRFLHERTVLAIEARLYKIQEELFDNLLIILN